MMNPHGTIQIGQCSVEYEIKIFEGDVEDCKFRILFKTVGQNFVTSGRVLSGHVCISEFFSMEDGDVTDNVRHRLFSPNPETWVKKSLVECVSKSVGQSSVENWTAVDGEIIESSCLSSYPGRKIGTPSTRPMPKSGTSS